MSNKRNPEDACQLLNNASLIKANESIKLLPIYQTKMIKDNFTPKLSSRHNIHKVMRLINAQENDTIIEWNVICSWSLKSLGYINSITIIRWMLDYKAEKGRENEQ